MTAHHIDRHLADSPTGPSKEANSMSEQAGVNERYEIRIAGHLASRWAPAFKDLTLTRHADGTTVLGGVIADQSALHGLLRRLGDLALPILSVRTVAEDDRTACT
jgi:hypothetical protein